MAVLVRLLALSGRSAGWMALAAVLSLATVMSGVGLMSAAAHLIARAALQPSIAELQVAIVGVRFFGISRGVFRYLERYVAHDATLRALSNLRVWFYRQIEPLAPTGLRRLHSGDLITGAITDIDSLQHVFVHAISPPLVAILSAAILTFTLGAIDRAMAAALLVGYLACGGFLPILAARLQQRVSPVRAGATAMINRELVSGLQGMADMLMLGGQDAFRDRLERQAGRLHRLERDETLVEAAHLAAIEFLAVLTALAMLWIAAPRIQHGDLDGVLVSAVTLGVLASFEAILPTATTPQHLQACLSAGRRLFQQIDAVPPAPSPLRPARRPATFAVQMKAVEFSYPDGSGPALSSVDWHLPFGSFRAVVGPSGAGKSTLVHLLAGLWPAQTGEVVLGGIPMQDYDPQDLRRWIGVVPQEPWFLSGTLRQALLLAKDRVADAELAAALHAAGLSPFVASLPLGLETRIGEAGLRLSAGERQRLALAQVFLRNPPIMILDEPTAHLDPLSQRRIFSTLARRIGRATTLLVTHQLVQLEAADEILVLDTGRPVQRGSHAALLAAEGLYRDLWRLQRQAQAFGAGLPDPGML
jgi:ATP-binding cassette, subfamily C, bacterial CydC